MAGDGQRWDFHNFYNAGTRIWTGQFAALYQPAEPQTVEPMYYVGFPASSLYLAPLGAFRSGIAVRAFKLSCLISMIVGWIVLYPRYREALRGQIPARWLLPLYLAVLLCFEPFWFTFVIGGQSTPHAFALIALFFVAYLNGRNTLAGLCLVLAVLVKPFLVLTLPILLLTGQYRLLFRVAVVGSVVGAASIAIFGWSLHVEWLQIVLQEGARWAAPWTKNASLSAIATNWFVHVEGLGTGRQPMPAALLRIIACLKLLTLLWFAWLALRLHRAGLSGQARREQACTLALMFPLFFSTIAWSHYYQVLLIPLLIFLHAWPKLGRSGRGLMLIMLLATLRANWYPLGKQLGTIEVHTPLQWLFASLYSSGVMLALLLFLLVSYGVLLEASQAHARQQGKA